MSQTLGETMMASFMASTKEIPDIFILVVVEGLTPLFASDLQLQSLRVKCPQIMCDLPKVS